MHVVDADPTASRRLAMVIEGRGHVVQTWSSAVEFIAAVGDVTPGCVVIDPYQEGGDAGEIQRRLAAPGLALPNVIVTACRDVEIAVAAMQAGAIDFIAKPADPDRLFAAIAVGAQRLTRARRREATMRRVNAALDMLSGREREVLEGLTRGWSNKEIARHMAISARTVEVHRANLMVKLDAQSLSQALRIAFISHMCAMINPALHE
ncbi:response regulator transcription factor [Sphingomonas sp. CLY1604]|uniref:response regulator transcription factor n=1 Tax=Sphingomonas sp. CLY1604 TaxID=3457786 RepID=UPI003FD8CA5F